MSTEPPASGPEKRARISHAQPLGILAIDGGLLTLETVSDLTGLGKSTIRKMVIKGDFPTPVRVTVRAVRWRAEEIRVWLMRRRPVAV